MSAKRKQEGKWKWSYEVKPKKIKIPGSCSVVVAAGRGRGLFGESAAWLLIKPYWSYLDYIFSPELFIIVCVKLVKSDRRTADAKVYTLDGF